MKGNIGISAENTGYQRGDKLQSMNTIQIALSQQQQHLRAISSNTNRKIKPNVQTKAIE